MPTTRDDALAQGATPAALLEAHDLLRAGHVQSAHRVIARSIEANVEGLTVAEIRARAKIVLSKI